MEVRVGDDLVVPVNTNVTNGFQVSDTDVIGTLTAIGLLIMLTISIVTWLCIKRSSGVTRTSGQRSSQRSLLSRQSTLSNDQFRRLLKIYHTSGEHQQLQDGGNGGSRKTKGSYKCGDADRRTSPGQRRLSSKPLLTSLPKLPLDSVHEVSISTPERFRLSASSTPSSQVRMPIGSIPINLDMQSPTASMLSDHSYLLHGHGTRFNDGGHFTRAGSKRISSRQSAPTAERSQDAPAVDSFYFSWPEEEEETENVPWSPLLLQVTLEPTIEEISKKDDASAPVKDLHSSDTTKAPFVDQDHESNEDIPTQALAVGLKSTWV